MANHTYALSDLTTACKMAVGSNTAPTNVTFESIVNDAVQYLADYADWNWRNKALSLNFTASTNSVNLPADFSAIHSAVRNSSWVPLEPTTLEAIQLMRVRTDLSMSFSTVWYALNITPQTSVTAEPVWKMELYPTPTANETGAIIGTYQRLIPKLTTSTDVPDVPADYHPALRDLCRAFAIDIITQERDIDWTRAHEKLEKLKTRDGLRAPSIGFMTGAVNTSRDWHDDIVRGSITP